MSDYDRPGDALLTDTDPRPAAFAIPPRKTCPVSPKHPAVQSPNSDNTPKAENPFKKAFDNSKVMHPRNVTVVEAAARIEAEPLRHVHGTGAPTCTSVKFGTDKTGRLVICLFFKETGRWTDFVHDETNRYLLDALEDADLARDGAIHHVNWRVTWALVEAWPRVLAPISITKEEPMTEQTTAPAHNAIERERAHREATTKDSTPKPPSAWDEHNAADITLPRLQKATFDVLNAPDPVERTSSPVAASNGQSSDPGNLPQPAPETSASAPASSVENVKELATSKDMQVNDPKPVYPNWPESPFVVYPMQNGGVRYKGVKWSLTLRIGGTIDMAIPAMEDYLDKERKGIIEIDPSCKYAQLAPLPAPAPQPQVIAPAQPPVEPATPAPTANGSGGTEHICQIVMHSQDAADGKKITYDLIPSINGAPGKFKLLTLRNPNALVNAGVNVPDITPEVPFPVSLRAIWSKGKEFAPGKNYKDLVQLSAE